MKSKIAALCLLVCTPGALAIPFLQLDIGGGVYVGGGEESIFSVGNPFTLYALVNTNSSHYSPGQSYYLSAAIVPQTSPGDTGYGSFTVDGALYDHSNMVFGKPPIETDTMPSHGIFETHYAEIPFTTLPGTASEYNSELNPGGPTDDAAGSLLYHAFVVDMSGLTSDISSVHFDLYTKKANGKVDQKAPFSHDAQGGFAVPDGGPTAILLGGALLAMAGVRRVAQLRRA